MPTRRTPTLEERQQEQVDAGYGLVYALLHDPLFTEVRRLSGQALQTSEDPNALSPALLRALSRAEIAYGVRPKAT